MRKPKKPDIRREPYHTCAVQGCPEPGDFKAPAIKGSEGKYQYLCLEHVRKFNQAWNYFDGWNREEIETFMHSSVHGHRPTWSVHELAKFTTASLEEALHRMMAEDAPIAYVKPETKAERKRREALAVLNLEPGIDQKSVKSQYKKLVKKYHPDVNSSKEAEETFKRITEAYVFLTKEAQRT